MGGLLRNNWLWTLFAFTLGAVITWFLLPRQEPAAITSPTPPQPSPRPPTPPPAPPTSTAPPTPAPPAPVDPVPADPGPSFSRRMDAERRPEPTLFDDTSTSAEPEAPGTVPPGRYGEGSADAVPHQGPPDGFTIKGNAQSMLFHTPDSPYYGRTKPEVWFRTESDAERAGFTKYTRRPRKSADPRD